MCYDSSIFVFALFFLAAINGAVGLVIFLVIKAFVILNEARRSRA